MTLRFLRHNDSCENKNVAFCHCSTSLIESMTDIIVDLQEKNKEMGLWIAERERKDAERRGKK